MAAQFTEDEDSPQESPELVGVGERNAAADADIFCGVLLEQVADDPNECSEGACAADAIASSAAPTHITSAPPRTPSHRCQPALRNSLKNRKPQKMPSRLLEFHSGKAMLSPTSRIAKMVSVLATAHKHPARTAQTTRCGARRTSARTDEVPRTSAGTLQRARKTPSTITSETTIGERPMVTSLVGASAAPSHAPAVKPERMPMSWSLRARAFASGVA